MSSAAEALDRSDFKASTVLAGSAIEALLLWSLQDAGQTGPVAAMTTRPRGSPEGWELYQLIEATELLGLIKPETATQCSQARDFRNLIHPGRSQRLSVHVIEGLPWRL
jgi:hypothetical protein